MAQIRAEHIFNATEDTYWGKIFFAEEYNRRLHLEALRFLEWREVRVEDKGDYVERTVEVVPRVGELPGPIKKLIGDRIGYVERGIYDKRARRYRITVTPSRLADKLTITGELFTEPAPEGRCRRIYLGRVEARIFGVGGLLEKLIVSDLEKSLETSARFTNQYIKEKG
jgi:hypothetical protein